MLNRSNEMKKILITGATGLIGVAVIEKIIETKSDIKVYAASSRPDKLQIVDKNLKIISNKDIEDILKKEKIDILLQLAFPRNVSEDKWADGIKYAIDILTMARKYGVERVVNVSSQSIYGLKRTKSADEKHEIFLNSPYTTGKYCTEVITSNLFEEGKYTNIRLSTTIGPTTKERVPNKLFSQIVEGKNLEIRGGNQRFAFLDIRDAADGLLCLIKHDDIVWKNAYNLGTRESNSLVDIANFCVQIGKEHGFDKTTVIVSTEDVVLDNQVEVSLFEKEFGWKAKYELRKSLRYIFEEVYI